MDRAQTGAPSSRLDRWRAGWRVSLRMARRDVRRHRGRSLLVVVMVGLPVLLLTAATTLWFTDDLDATERLPLTLGHSQGYLLPRQPLQQRQLVDPSVQQGWPGTPPPALPVPGLTERGEMAALGTMVHARLVEVGAVPTTFRSGEHYVTGTVLGADLTDPAVLAPRVTLESGRWPATPDEILVTAQGIEHGLPESGQLGLRTIGSSGEAPERTVTIVGTGRGFDARGGQFVQQADVVSAPVTSDYASSQWLVVRAEPITWAEVARLNTYGVGVFSRYVAEHPATMTRVTGDESTVRESTLVLVVSLTALGLVLLTTLLAGPAFAVSAARQRRTLALAASNGATTAQLRRTVLAQALVLGVLSAAVGVALGVVGAVAAVGTTRIVRPDIFVGPTEVPWVAVGLVAAAAIISSVVAALIPSRGLGRLDVVSVLRGQGVSPTLRRRIPVLGTVLVAGGAVAVTWASFQDLGAAVTVAAFVGGSVAIVVGSLMIVPLVLALVARGAHRLPLALRMASREAGRQRGRATPTVAAIMAGASALTVICIGVAADTTRASADYVPATTQGQGVVRTSGATPARLLDLEQSVTTTSPTLHSLVVRDLVDYRQDDGRVIMVARRPGCTIDQLLPQPIGGDVAPDLSPRCATASTMGRDYIAGASATLQAADLGSLASFLDLDARQQEVLAAGGVAVVDPAEVADLAPATPSAGSSSSLEDVRPVTLDESAGRATFVTWHQKVMADGSWVRPSASDTVREVLPVVHLTREQWTRLYAAYGGGPAGLVTSGTAARLGLGSTPSVLLVRADGGITPELESRLSDALRARQRDATIQVERGFQHDGLGVAIIFGVIGLVILVATLIATALSQTENAPLLGTLAAIGATRRTRRALAGAQATYLGLLGAVLGVLVGLAPGLGLARIVLTRVADDGTRTLSGSVGVPWLQILPLLLVPLVGGALAWVSIRRAPVVVRRAT